MNNLKGEFIFFIRELDVPPLGESNLMGPKKSVEVKFFMVAFFGVRRAWRTFLPFNLTKHIRGSYI